jgi:hypothetical protein
MRFKYFIVLLVLFVSAPSIEARTNGYLSFEYSRGLQNDEQKSGSFQDVQLGLVFSGALSPGIEYLGEFLLKEEGVEVEQVWIGFFSSETLRLKMGLYLVPFGRYNQFSRPHENLLVYPPLNVVHAYPQRWRDIGILAEGRIGSFVYSAYIGNGLSEGSALDEGQQFGDNNRNKGVGGRVGWLVSQSFEVAYSHYRGKIDAEDTRKTVLQGVDLTWSPEGFHMLAEYTRGISENPEGYEKGEVEGFFVQVSLVLQKIRPVASVQKLKYSDPFHGPGFFAPDTPGDGIRIDLTRWALGLVFAPLPNVLLKLEYDLDKDRNADLKSSAITFQAALSF